MEKIKSANLIISIFLIFAGLTVSIYITIFFPIIIETHPVYYEMAKSIMNPNHNFSEYYDGPHIRKFYTFGYPALISGYFFNSIDLTIRIVQFLSLMLIWLITFYSYYLSNKFTLFLNTKLLDINFIWIFFWLSFLQLIV